jgi:hypothetical protein
MNQVQKTTSGSLQIQLGEPKKLSDFVESLEEIEIVRAVENSMQIARTKNVEDALILLISKWRIYIGIPKTDVSEELAIICQFINKNYSFLTLEEINLAIELSIKRKLPDTEFFGYFSPMYVAKVFDSYLYYRKITMADAIRRKEKHEAEIREQLNKPTSEQQANSTKEIMRGFYNDWKERGEISDPFSLAYNYLRKHNFLEVSKEDIEKAQEYAKMKIANMKKEDRTQMFTESDEKRLARNWCVQKYFQTVDIDVLINNIKPEQFT